MPKTEFPGVYLGEVPTRTHPIEGVSTSTAGFIGRPAKPDIADGRFVHNVDDYERGFGAIRYTGSSTDVLGLAVQAFFANGGTRAYIAPLARRGTDRSRYAKAFALLDEIRSVAMICLPSVTAGTRLGAVVLPLAVEAAEKLQRGMLIVDPPREVVLSSEADVERLRLPASSFAALYYPWVKVENRYADRAKHRRRPVGVLVPPCGFAAGVWARTEAVKGVWVPPAGFDGVLRGASRLSHEVTTTEQRRLAPLGINCLRMSPAGLAIQGARTLAPQGENEWKYVPVRRLTIFIEASIAAGTQWAVFEPNAKPLWSALRAHIEPFLIDLWRQGALVGRKPEEAFFVRCDRSTMTQDDIDAGLAIVTIGFAPLRPAEFVIVRIGQWTANRPTRLRRRRSAKA